MCAPLPEEAVGKGAKWEVTMRIGGRVQLTQVATVTVKELGEAGVELSLEVVQNAPQQEIKMAVPGAKAELISLESKGSGSLKADLRSVVPTESVVKLASKQKMEITSGGSTTKMNQSMDMEVAFSSM